MNSTHEVKQPVAIFIKRSVRFLERFMRDDGINYFTAEELLKITNEDATEFLSRDPFSGYWKPELYAIQVFETFINDQTYYYDKFLREKNNQTKTN